MRPAHHSTTLDTWMAQVGRERALGGSWNSIDDNNVVESAAMAGPTKARATPALNKPETHFWFLRVEQILEGLGV